ncbi:MAG: 16S rRNA (cytidine(1402)-2'-O)-methyltransferase [Proteobacteria bacterium]|nr:16S rRNA (cytidine(1402)-2'-O)-methyltransferase [Pseudomonadota bacterium]
MPTKGTVDNRQNLPEKAGDSKRTGPLISMIATPIGNLGDLSARAVGALRGVDELWCEDTRHTRQLLNALGIEEKRLRRLDQHSREQEIRGMLKETADRRQWIGVVTDAGTPGLSDPGAGLVRLLPEFPEILLEPIPGPSAAAALVSIAGFEGSSFYFHGFFPRVEKEALALLDDAERARLTRNLMFFESPHRIRATLALLESWCVQGARSVEFVFAKELTKIHETVYRGAGAPFLKSLQDQLLDERGEWVFSVVLSKDGVKNEPAEAAWDAALQCLLEAGISPKNAAQIVASRFSVAKNLAYKRALESQKKSKDH